MTALDPYGPPATLRDAMTVVLAERRRQSVGGWMERVELAHEIATRRLALRKDGSPWPSYWIGVECERGHSFESTGVECDRVRLRASVGQTRLEAICLAAGVEPDDWYHGHKNSTPCTYAHWWGKRWHIALGGADTGYWRPIVEVRLGNAWQWVELPHPDLTVDFMLRENMTIDEIATVVRAVMVAEGRIPEPSDARPR